LTHKEIEKLKTPEEEETKTKLWDSIKGYFNRKKGRQDSKTKSKTKTLRTTASL
jgi:hypothetical protein